ncbi:MAG: inorganic phosphate transporter [Candidatus Micrarchaeaceae archaeon]
MSILLPILAFLLIALVAGNNLSACSGTIIGSNILSKRSGILLTFFGYASGMLLQGSELKVSIDAIIPYRSEEFVALALFIALVIFFIAHKKKIPQSLSVTFTGVILGIGIATNSQINWFFIISIFVFWIAATFFSAFFMYLLLRPTRKLALKGHLWKKAHYIRIMLILLSFFSAFTLGANTIGLVYSAIPNTLLNIVVLLVALLFGSFVLSAGELKTIADKIIPIRYLNAISSQAISTLFVETATIFGMPLSNTQTLTASVFGAGLSYKSRLLRRKPLYEIVAVWITGIAVSLPLSFLLAKLFFT